jgi:hypothetical protein
MRYSLSDLENRFAGRPNARWSSIRAELKRLETAEALREESEIQRIEREIRDEEEAIRRALIAANEIGMMLEKPSYFDRLMRWFR